MGLIQFESIYEIPTSLLHGNENTVVKARLLAWSTKYNKLNPPSVYYEGKLMETSYLLHLKKPGDYKWNFAFEI